MPKLTGTASEFALHTLTTHADREIQIAELHQMAAGKFTKAAIAQGLEGLVAKGKIIKVRDGREAWFAIA